jgi:hypothetical protein
MFPRSFKRAPPNIFTILTAELYASHLLRITGQAKPLPIFTYNIVIPPFVKQKKTSVADSQVKNSYV